MYRKTLLLLSVLSTLFLANTSFTATSDPAANVSFSSLPGIPSTDIVCVAAFPYPENSVESFAINDILTAHLLQAGIKVVSNETIVRIRQRLLRKVEAQMEEEQSAKGVADANEPGKSTPQDPAEGAKREETPFLDNLAVAEEAGADCILKVNTVIQAIQQNVYDGEGRRVTEVRTETRVSLITVSIVSAGGSVLKVGCTSFVEPVSVASAAEAFGRALARELGSK